jgi:hypothetical protein
MANDARDAVAGARRCVPSGVTPCVAVDACVRCVFSVDSVLAVLHVACSASLALAVLAASSVASELEMDVDDLEARSACSHPKHTPGTGSTPQRENIERRERIRACPAV